MIYDLIIIGSGPAGMSAGLYAGRARLKTLIIEKSNYGGRINDTLEIINYPGIKKISGENLTKLFKEQINNFNLDFLKTTINKITKENDYFKIISKRKGEFYSKTIIIATGTRARVLGIEGEEEFVGNGVAYCATCDAEFFKNQYVFVLGSGDQAIEEAIYISKFAKKVTIVVIHNEGKLDCNEIAKEEVFKNSKINFIWNSTVSKINGTDTLESVDVINLKTNEITNYKTNGLFSFVGTIPNTEFIKDIIKVDKQGYIIVNEKKETSMQGIYAIGDCTNNYLKQVITSCADGAIAATAIERFITEKNIISKEIKNNKKIIFVFYNPYIQNSLNNLTFFEKNKNNNIKTIKIDISKQNYLYNKLNLKNNFNIVAYYNENIIFILNKENINKFDICALYNKF